MVKLLLNFKRKEWVAIFIATIFIVGGVWLDLKLPDYIRNITTIITNEGAGTMTDVWINGGWMLLCAVGSAITVVVVGYIASKVSASSSTRLRKRLFEKVGTFSTAEMKKYSIASLITRSTNDITQVQTFSAMAIQMLIKAPITAVWAVLKILGKSQELSAVTAIAVASLIVVILVMIILVLPKFKRIQKLIDNLNQVTRENLTGIRVVRAYNAEEFESKKFETANSKLTKTNLFTNRVMGIMGPFMTLLLSGLSLAIWWIGADLMQGMSPQEIGSFFPDIMVFMNYSVQIIFSFIMLIVIFMMLPRVTISARRINEVLYTKPSIVSGSETADTETTGQIEFNNVNFRYPDAEAYILKDINLKINKGQTVAFIGSTGSGKSTLVNLLPRIYDATEGEILLDGKNIRDYKIEVLNDKVGYVPQTAVIFKGSIASNVAFGNVRGEPISEEKVKSALEIAQATDFVKKMKDGINSEISQSGKNLSGGQKQRVAIARVIAREPEIFIFDDTFSALDYKTDKLLRAALKKATKDATTLIVAQRIGTIKDADIIVVLNEGEIVGKGTHKELMKTCNIYQEIAYSQLSKEELA